VTKLVRDLVRQGIRKFERHNPGWKVSKQVVGMLEAHGAKHQRHIMEELRSENTTKAALAEGLRYVLEQSILERTVKVRRSDWVNAYWTYQDAPERHRSAGGTPQRRMSVSAVRLAMKSKCKTYPWC
jgi:hypothetical protein